MAQPLFVSFRFVSFFIILHNLFTGFILSYRLYFNDIYTVPLYLLPLIRLSGAGPGLSALSLPASFSSFVRASLPGGSFCGGPGPRQASFAFLVFCALSDFWDTKTEHLQFPSPKYSIPCFLFVSSFRSSLRVALLFFVYTAFTEFLFLQRRIARPRFSLSDFQISSFSFSFSNFSKFSLLCFLLIIWY